MTSTLSGVATTAGALGVLSPTASQIAIPTGGLAILSANCNAGAFTGTLYKQ
jgi:hypothetical protein